MKKLFSTGVLMLFLITGVFICGFPVYAQKKVLLAFYVDNPDYAIARYTFREGLKVETEKTGLEVEFITLDTQGDKKAFISRIKELAPQVDLIYTTGTPNTIAVKSAQITTPVIFTAVADPIGAKLVNSLEKPGTNFTGSHCAVAEEKQFKALLLTLPNVRKIGILYNPDDPAPSSQAKNWKETIIKEGLEYLEFFIPSDVQSAEGLAQAAKTMIGKVDVIVTTADAKVSPYGEGMIRVANENKIPTYVTLNQLVKKGALVSLGFNFIEGAKLNISQAIEVLGGRSPAVIPITTFPEYKLVINLKTAEEIGVVIPFRALNTASEIIR